MARLDIEINTTNVQKVSSLTNSISKLESEQLKLKQNNLDINKSILALDKTSDNYKKTKEQLTNQIKQNTISLKENTLTLNSQKKSHKEVTNSIKTHEKAVQQLATEAIKANKKIAESAKSLARATSLAYETSARDEREAIAETSARVQEAHDLKQKELKETQRQQEIANTASAKSEAILRRQENQLKKSATASEKFRDGLKAIGIATLAYIAINRLKDSIIRLSTSFVKTADSMSLVNSRLSLVTHGTEQYTIAQQELLRISNDARVGLTATSDLYSQLARSTQELNISQTDLLGVSKTISQTLTISGTSAASANAALFQLSQGFSAGALRGEELNSVLEQTPRLAQAIAQGLGVSIGELRALGAEGTLTAETVLNSLKSQADSVNAEFQNIAVNASQGYTVLNNMIDSSIAKLDEQNKITQTIGETFVALSETVDTLVSTAFTELTSDSIDFGDFATQSIAEVIRMSGILYDSFETVGDIFNFVAKSGEFAFYGLVSGVSFVAGTIGKMFESLTNDIIGMINVAINGINMIGGNIPTIGRVDFSSQNLSNASIAGNRALAAGQELEVIRNDLFEVSTVGRDTVETMISQFTTKFDELRSKNTQSQKGTATPIVSNGSTITDTTGSTFNLQDEIKKQEEYTQKMLEDMDTTREEISDTNDTIKDTTDSFKDFNDLIYNDDDSVNDSINNVTDSFNNFGDSANNVDYSVIKATEALDKFIFQFSDTFINSITDNISSLESIANSGTISTKSYQEALQDVRDVQNELKNNPLSVTIGNEFKTAYDAFISSSTDYLESSNFSNSKDLEFAQRSFNIRSQGFQDTASNTVDVLDSMNTFLESINQAFSDGILTDAERTDIKGVAGEVNDKNTALMGGISSDLVGDNSVSGFIKALTSNIDSGVSISDLLNSTTIASVATGLKTDQISNLKNASDKTAAATEFMTSNNSTALKNLQISRTNVSYTKYTDSGGYERTGTNQEHGGVITQYEYVGGGDGYAQGGFTGNGMGKKDSTGFKQAGIVHEGEYVAPKWMVDSQPQIFNALESARKSKGFAQGGYTSTMKATTSNDMGGSMHILINEMQKLNATFNRVTENGESMSVILRAG